MRTRTQPALDQYLCLPGVYLYCFGDLKVEPSAIAMRGPGGCAPPNECLRPQFNLLKILFLEHNVTKQQTTMKTGKKD